MSGCIILRGFFLHNSPLMDWRRPESHHIESLEGGRKGGREAGREGGREGGREEGREGEGGREGWERENG